MKKLLAILLMTTIAGAIFSCGTKQEPKTIYIVRHAEKQLEKEDPPLSVAGTVRSKKLAQILENRDIEHIFITNTLRTRLTATPLAEKTGIAMGYYSAQDQDALVKELREIKGNVLVVGHSNSIHHLANYFIGQEPKIPPIEEIDYENIFIVELKEDGKSELIKRKYRDY
ncbi:SixA phosphatase family protein [Pararhodonellum marinum]|uniref:SixA phosphatase family protein n=1 Tax=Pararhodonellum marinum TaxID=2755358 RepID=UPI00188F8A22|nr:phosphoglycerate mutase family protein [Pararhodonellum marinum]